MHFHILGAGALGLLVGFHLRQKGHRVTLLLRNAGAVDAFRESGSIRLTSEFDSGSQEREAKGVEAETSRQSPAPIAHLLVATKAYQAATAFADVHQRLSPESAVVLLQNGIGVEEQLVQQFYRHRSPSAMPSFGYVITAHGCLRQRPFEVVHTGPGLFCSGPAPASANAPRLHATLEALQALGLDPDHPAPLDAASLCVRQLSKLVINACINALTGLLGCRNGRLVDVAPGGDLLDQVCDEAAGIIWAATDPAAAAAASSRLPVLSDALRAELHADRLRATVRRVCRLTQRNRSSMLVDVDLGRPTEIDTINGYLVRLAEAHGMDAPINRLLWRLVRMRSELAHEAGTHNSISTLPTASAKTAG